MHSFKSLIYKVGINAVAHVPEKITAAMVAVKGYIRIKGTINGFEFKTTLVPVKGKPYHLFVNIPMLKGAKAALGDIAEFSIEQDATPVEQDYPMNEMLLKQLKEHKLLADFESLSPSRRKDILKYLNYIKTEITLQKNIDKVIKQLKDKHSDVRIP